MNQNINSNIKFELKNKFILNNILFSFLCKQINEKIKKKKQIKK